jgi:PPOX class probable F420-dependent enzyme
VPRPPLPPELVEFVRAPRPAVIGTVRPDGTPSTTATWYEWQAGRLLLSMVADGPRLRNVRHNPGISLTILGEDWYDHVTVLGRAAAFEDDPRLADLDRLSLRYRDEPYPKRHLRCVSVIMEIERWHSWGEPRAGDPHTGDPHPGDPHTGEPHPGAGR